MSADSPSILSMVNVTKVFGEGPGSTRALDGVDLEITEREVVAVMGPSGAGKTTMLTIAGALQRPTSGEVRLDGERIDNLPEKRMAELRRKKIGFIFQAYNLLQALTAVENVQMALELNGLRGKHARERAAGLLGMLDMGSRMNELPKRLSGGEQQRVAVARAFANNASIILADEPTANLDSTRAAELMGLVRATSRDMGRPVLMVTHDLRVHHLVDRMLWLEEGHLTAIERDSPLLAGRPG